MARMRTLKPGFFSNEALAEVSPIGRLLFAGLWCLADREGRLEDRPKRIKAEVLPYDKTDVDRLLSSLAEHGFIERYEVDGDRLIQVINFKKHQTPHIKEQASTLPPPCEHRANTGQAPPDPDPGSGIGDPGNGIWVVGEPSEPQPGVRLEPEQDELLSYLRQLVHREVLKGVNGPDVDWGRDLIQRGAKQSDIDYASQECIRLGKRTLGYYRTILERRVEERENGIDHEQLARDRAADARSQPHGRSSGARGVAPDGASRSALEGFGDAPAGSIRASDHVGAAEESPGGSPPLSFTGRDRASGVAG